MKWFSDPFRKERPKVRDEPFDGNQAIPTLLFEKYQRRFKKNFPLLKIIKKEKMDSILYPLSGGFHNRNLCPSSLYKILGHVEQFLSPFSKYLAFRFFIVLEKR